MAQQAQLGSPTRLATRRGLNLPFHEEPLQLARIYAVMPFSAVRDAHPGNDLNFEHHEPNGHKAYRTAFTNFTPELWPVVENDQKFATSQRLLTVIATGQYEPGEPEPEMVAIRRNGIIYVMDINDTGYPLQPNSAMNNHLIQNDHPNPPALHSRQLFHVNLTRPDGVTDNIVYFENFDVRNGMDYMKSAGMDLGNLQGNYDECQRRFFQREGRNVCWNMFFGRYHSLCLLGYTPSPFHPHYQIVQNIQKILRGGVNSETINQFPRFHEDGVRNLDNFFEAVINQLNTRQGQYFQKTQNGLTVPTAGLAHDRLVTALAHFNVSLPEEVQ